MAVVNEAAQASLQEPFAKFGGFTPRSRIAEPYKNSAYMAL